MAMVRRYTCVRIASSLLIDNIRHHTRNSLPNPMHMCTVILVDGVEKWLKTAEDSSIVIKLEKFPG